MSKKLVILLGFVILVGCKSGSQKVASHPAAPGDAALASGTTAADPEGFSWKRAMQLVGFAATADEQGSLVPQEVVQMTTTVNTIVARAAELNAADPPHVTAEKARAILEAIRPWENALAAVRALGLVKPEQLNSLQGLVKQLGERTQHLVQFGGQPETIGAVKNLAGQLQATYGAATSLFSSGAAAYQAMAAPPAGAAPGAAAGTTGTAPTGASMPANNVPQAGTVPRRR